jgi:RHS repeat-associated protein
MKRLLLTFVALFWIAAAAQAQEVVEYYHTDALGSVRAVTGQSGAVIARHDYLPFGEEYLPQAGNDPRRFTGKERDAETGLDYFQARYYRAGAGRFMTVDPGHVNGNIFDPQSWNGYAYARNNPLRFTDPTGTAYQICPKGGTCQSVSDRYFGYLEDHAGSGISLRDGVIFATVNGNEVVAGSYQQTSVDPTFNDFIRQTGERADGLLTAGSIGIGAAALVGATGGLAAGAFSGGLGTAGMVTLGGETGLWSGGAINQVIGMAQRNLLRSFLKDGRIPAGLERRTLELYRMVAKQYLAETRGNAAGIAEQARRVTLIEEALKRLR